MDMGHKHIQESYTRLVNRLNKFPQGAPPSDVLHKILALLFTEREAHLVALLPLRPFTAKRAAKAWKMDLNATKKKLDQLADRAILVDIEDDGNWVYCLPPPMAGFFEFSMMRVRTDVDQKVLSELFYQYINTEDDFIKALILGGETPLGRVFVQERALSQENALHVLNYERAAEVICTAQHIGISLCYCRHKMSHLERACEAPLDICMTFNNSAASLIRHSFARPVTASECLDLLHRAQANNLVQFGENVRQRVNFICNCCGCCCEALLAIQKLGLVRPIHSNFIARIQKDRCIDCGNCIDVCPIKAIQIHEGQNKLEGTGNQIVIDETMCLGCGVCVANCPSGALHLDSRSERVITPVDTVHRTVVMAIERGTLQHLIFDNQVLQSHRLLAAVLGAILKLPPVKRAMACKQLKSRYLEALLRSGPTK
jgi:ferredoxin